MRNLINKINELLETPLGGWVNAAALAAIPILVTTYLGYLFLKEPPPKAEPPITTGSIPKTKKPPAPLDETAKCIKDRANGLTAAQKKVDAVYGEIDTCRERERRLRHEPSEDEIQRSCATHYDQLKVIRRAQYALKASSCP